jgi:7-cyano-7-deazaguanine synthase in queuosine biosynthesis
MTDPKPHIILCNGATCNDSAANAQDCLKLAYCDGMGVPQNINLGLPDFLRDVVYLPDRVLDLLEIAAYVYCADRSVRRGEKDAVEYHAWARSFHFFIKVRDHAFWQRSDVCVLLNALLRFIAGDHEYRFTFQSGHSTPPAHLFDSQAFVLGTHENAEIVLFSGGLDSLTGILERLTTTNKHLYLISHRSLPSTSLTQEKLVNVLKEKFPGRLDHYKFLCNRKSLEERRAKEETQRTRFFLYTSIAYALAHALGQNCVHAFENGITSLNIAKQESLIEARASRTTHPKTIHLLNRLFSLIATVPFAVHTPYFWLTKTDVIKRLAQYNGAGLYTASVSCSKTFKLEHKHTHCGVCSQCVDRRFAANSGGMGDYDDAVTYALDVIQGEIIDGAARTTLVDFVRQADTFAKCGCDQFLNDFLNPLAEAVDYVSLADDMEAARRIWELCHRHGVQVMQAARDIKHEREDLGSKPPPGSLLDILNSREYLKPPILRLVDSVEARFRRALPLAFQTNRPKDERDLNDKISAILDDGRVEWEREHPPLKFALAETVPDHVTIACL